MPVWLPTSRAQIEREKQSGQGNREEAVEQRGRLILMNPESVEEVE